MLDVNSLYPHIMYTSQLPYGEPEFVPGKVDPSNDRPLTIFSITFVAKLKPNHIPCIQVKGSNRFVETEYLSEIKEPTTLTITNIDFELYNKHYDLEVLEYHGGWRFRAARGMFKTYIDKWSKIKAESTGGKREIAKLFLVSLYGKFASNPLVKSKIPYFENDEVKFALGVEEERAPVYTPVGVFITSHARHLTISAAQRSYLVFAYCDTDSLHLFTDTAPAWLDIDPNKMGAWKLEYSFDEAYYIRAKAYLERHGDTFTNRVAGLPERISETLTFDDLKPGTVLEGKLTPKVVPGGVVLKNVSYALKV